MNSPCIISQEKVAKRISLDDRHELGTEPAPFTKQALAIENLNVAALSHGCTVPYCITYRKASRALQVQSVPTRKGQGLHNARIISHSPNASLVSSSAVVPPPTAAEGSAVSVSNFRIGGDSTA